MDASLDPLFNRAIKIALFKNKSSRQSINSLKNNLTHSHRELLKKVSSATLILLKIIVAYISYFCLKKQVAQHLLIAPLRTRSRLPSFYLTLLSAISSSPGPLGNTIAVYHTISRHVIAGIQSAGGG